MVDSSVHHHYLRRDGGANRVHQEVFRGRVHPNLSGFTEKDIHTSRGEGLVCCWELVNHGGKTSDVISFLKVQNERLNQRVTAIVRTNHSTWIMDVGNEGIRITHFRMFPPRACKMSEAMKKYWVKRKEKERKAAEWDAFLSRYNPSLDAN